MNEEEKILNEDLTNEVKTEIKPQEKKEEEIEFTAPEQIAPFWRKPILHPLKDLYFEVYYVIQQEDGSRKWLPVNLPPDPKIGRIVPPFTEEEILEAGYGPGKYILRPRSIKTGKLLPGTETHILGVSQEYRQKEDLLRMVKAREQTFHQPIQIQLPPQSQIQHIPEPSQTYNEMFNMFSKIIEAMNAQQNKIFEAISKQQEKILEIITKQSKPETPDLSSQISTIATSIMTVLVEMEKARATLEGKKLDIDKELKLKEMDLKSKLDNLKAKLGELPKDEKYQELKNLIESLEDKLSTREKPDWKSTIYSIFTGIVDFLNMLTPIVGTVSKLQASTQEPLEKPKPYALKYKTKNVISEKDLEEIEKHIKEMEGGV